MANEAFVISPISARAAEPNEADYDAIREAFMETARGRWFLSEYAKRNRNSDTTLVLDAVARIEQTLAAQHRPIIEDRLPEALAAIHRAVMKAETSASAAFDQATLVTSLAPVHRGVRIIREISWRWREIGADGRICDLIDSQLATIEGACKQISATDPGAELKAAFDLLKGQIEQAGIAEDAAPQATTTAQPSPTPLQQACRAAEPNIAEPIAVDEPEELLFDPAAGAEDDAILDMVALEMAAPDPDFDEAIAELAEVAAQVGTPATGTPAVGAIAAEPTAPAGEVIAATESSLAVMERPAAQATPISTRPSSTILAAGLLKKPWATADDPFEPIRRMTQAEKIAFFS